MDLAAANANRDNVPWVVAFSHFPFFCTGCLSKNTKVSAKWYAGAEAEYRGALNQVPPPAHPHTHHEL